MPLYHNHSVTNYENHASRMQVALGYQGLSSVVLPPIYGQYPTVHLCPFDGPPSILVVFLSCTIARNSTHLDPSTFLRLL